MKDFFLFCSGANRAVLEDCPTETSKYVGIGATIFLTAVLACLSGGYALYTVFQSVLAAIPFGLLWGVVIFNLDRVIVSGMRKQKNRGVDVAYALPRLAIAILLGIVISRPLELRLFEGEIERQIIRNGLLERNRDIATIRTGDSRVKELEDENRRLNAEIEAKRQALNTASQEWIGELAGISGTGKAGPGPVYRERTQARDDAVAQLKVVEDRNKPLIARNDSAIARLRNEQHQQIADVDTVSAAAHGFLARMDALGALSEQSGTVHWSSILITLLFISLETAPVVVKLLSTFSPYRPYDELLEQREAEIVEKARQEVRFRKHQLKSETDQKIEERDEVKDAEVRISSKRNKLRMEAEVTATEALMQGIGAAQAEIALEVVERWKQRELENIENNPDAYVQTAP
jgi:hypothetical protein